MEEAKMLNYDLEAEPIEDQNLNTLNTDIQEHSNEGDSLSVHGTTLGDPNTGSKTLLPMYGNEPRPKDNTIVSIFDD